MLWDPRELLVWLNPLSQTDVEDGGEGLQVCTSSFPETALSHKERSASGSGWPLKAPHLSLLFGHGHLAIPSANQGC